MATATLEHVNFTVSDPDRTAALLVELFGWRVRWAGPSLNNGRTVHVGNENDYLALYTQKDAQPKSADNYDRHGGLNHVGVLVEDLDATEQRVLDAGLKPFNHASYEPGRRFYFLDPDGIEFEVVSYAGKRD